MSPSLRLSGHVPSPMLEFLEDRLLLSATVTPSQQVLVSAQTALCPAPQTTSVLPRTLQGFASQFLVCGDNQSSSQRRASNRPPETEADYTTTTPGQAVAVDVLRNDQDPEGKPLSISDYSQPANGSTERGPSAGSRPTVRYTPRTGYQGLDFFYYNAADNKGLTTREIAFVQVGDWVPPASWPCATGDSALPPQAVTDCPTTTAGRAISFNVLANDRDPDGGGVVLLGFCQPRNGTVKFDPARPGSVVYTPRAGFTGEDTFEYTICDGQRHVSKGTVKVKVNPTPVTPPTPAQVPAANRAPVATNDSVTTRPGRAVTVNVLGNDRDPDGDALTVVSVGTAGRGSTRIEGNKIVYTPGSQFTGNDTFTYRIRDARGAEATATVTVRFVNQAPVARNDEVKFIGNESVGVCVLNNDCDPDGDALQVISFAGTTARGGQVRRDPANANRLIYTPPANATGNDTFTYTISDGMGGTAVGTVRLIFQAPPCPAPAPPLVCGSVGGGSLLGISVNVRIGGWLGGLLGCM